MGSDFFDILLLNGKEGLLINLISIENEYNAAALTGFSEACAKKDIQVIQLWEDIWMSRREQVLSRLCSVLGLNKTVHGRKTKIVTVDQEKANVFFERHHLQGTAGCKYRYGLEFDQELIAVAGFSDKRPMNHTAGYTSAELIRFATVKGITVTGGLSKLISHFVKLHEPNDIMSYADRDWSDGKGYLRLGFTEVARTSPIQLYLQQDTMLRHLPHRLPAAVLQTLKDMEEINHVEYLKSLNYKPVYNTGNLKYILNL